MSCCVALRPFGCVEDLELAFEGADRPALVTAVLARCSAAGDPEFWWAQTVGSRIAALSRLLAASGGGDALTVSFDCSRPDCGESFEVAVAFAALADLAAADLPVAVTLSDGRSLSLRLPTGRDLHNWQGLSWPSRHEAVSAMIAALCVDAQACLDDEAWIDEALATRDPLVAFSVSCTCPSCGSEHDLPVDVEGIALARLAALQRALLHEIHVLASAYGWNERAILAIAPERRARYLSLIEDQR